MNRVYKCFQVNNRYYLYDRNKNKIIEIQGKDYHVLKNINSDNEFEVKSKELEIYTKHGFLKESTLKQIRHPATQNLNLFLDNKIEQLTLQVTQKCNLRCSYCFYGEGNYENRNHSNKIMNFETARKGINYILEHSKELNSIYISFYGGEPLLAFDLIKQCVKYINDSVEGKEIKYGMTTNGTLFNDKNIKFLVENNFSIMVSLDGNKEMHNINRKFSNGEGSFDVVMGNIEYIKREYPEFFRRINFNTVVSSKCDFKCVKDFFERDKLIDDNNVHISTVNNLYTNQNYSELDEEYYIVNRYENLKVFLLMIGKLGRDSISKLYLDRISNIKNTYRMLQLNNELEEYAHPSGPCIAGAMRLFVNVDGELFPCERVSEKSKIMNIGNLDSGLDIEKIKKLINVGQVTKDKCLGCWAFEYCELCAAYADDIDGFSSKKRLSFCESVHQAVLEKFKTICMLDEFGYDFEEEFFDEEANDLSL